MKIQVGFITLKSLIKGDNNMRDLIEMTYKCYIINCHECKYTKECLLCEILDVHTGNAPPIIDYPTPTQIIYSEGE